MHELSICQALLRQVAKLAEGRGASVVESITIEVGPLCGVEPALLASAFGILRAGGCAAQAALVIEETPVTIGCANCGVQLAGQSRELGPDLASGVVTIREKKRDKSKLPTRRVPLTPVLKEVLATWLKERGKGKTLFCKDDGKEITPREAMNYFDRALRTSKWNVLRGLHVFRHSFISAMASSLM